MPATQEKPRTDVLAQLEQLEAAHTKLKAEADILGRDHRAQLLKAQQLAGQRQKLVYREPALVDHTGVATDVRDNPVKLLDKEAESLPDLDDLAAQAVHAKKLADRAQQDIERHTIEHYDAITEADEELARAVTEEANDAIKVAADKAEACLGACHRLMGRAATARRNNRVDALDQIAGVSRTLKDTTLPTPAVKR